MSDRNRRERSRRECNRASPTPSRTVVFPSSVTLGSIGLGFWQTECLSAARVVSTAPELRAGVRAFAGGAQDHLDVATGTGWRAKIAGKGSFQEVLLASWIQLLDEVQKCFAIHQLQIFAPGEVTGLLSESARGNEDAVLNVIRGHYAVQFSHGLDANGIGGPRLALRNPHGFVLPGMVEHHINAAICTDARHVRIEPDRLEELRGQHLETFPFQLLEAVHGP